MDGQVIFTTAHSGHMPTAIQRCKQIFPFDFFFILFIFDKTSKFFFVQFELRQSLYKCILKDAKQTIIFYNDHLSRAYLFDFYLKQKERLERYWNGLIHFRAKSGVDWVIPLINTGRAPVVILTFFSHQRYFQRKQPSMQCFQSLISLGFHV